MSASRRIALALLLMPALAGAQRQPPRPVPQPGQPTRAPLATADTTKRDSLARFSAPDSVMQALLKKPGYSVTRYEGETVTFDNDSKALAIAAAAARRAIVERDSQRVVTDSTIGYDQRTNRASVSSTSRGKYEITLGQGQAPIQGSGTGGYDLGQQSGRLTNVRLTADEGGERWFIQSEISTVMKGDSARGVPMRFYGLGGTLTSCDDSLPDYHFRLREIKRTEKTLVARPAVMYLQDIPVMWLPFVFQDIRPGRRSGILPPGFGASDIVRNNPNYRRYIENIGYYWAISDYVDMAAWVDWRSAAGGDSTDPGWYKLNAEWKYNWMSRFLSGRIATSYNKDRVGAENLAVSWGHQQKLGSDRNINADVNYTTSTTLQRRNTFIPAAAIATIVSRVGFSDKFGPASLQIGGQQTQFPGREQVERAAPSITLSTTSMAIGDWLVWTPSIGFNESATLKIDQPSTFSTRYVSDANGQLIRVDTLDRNRFERQLNIASPLRLFGFDLGQNVTIRDRLLDYPEEVLVYPDADSSRKEFRVFHQTFRTDIDWNPVLSLPPIFRNRFKLTPSVQLSNVDGGPYWVRSMLSGGKFVHQSKRLSYGLSAAPTMFGLFPGFGPFSRVRHAISPTLSYSYAPSKRVSDDYLEAIGLSKQVYLGSLAQNSVTLGLTQNFEAKIRGAETDSSGSDATAQKIKLLSTTFSPLTYDFERARKTGRRLSGFTSESFSSTLTSDLLPGFDISAQYSLFEGSTQTDTARFSPYMTSLSSRMSFSQTNNPLAVITRLFGKAVPERSEPVTPATRPDDISLARQMATQPVAGQSARTRQFMGPQTQGWQATINFSSSRSRPVRGGHVVDIDPRVQCERLRDLNPFLYDECLRQPALQEPIAPVTAGSPIIRTPRQTSATGNMSFGLTEKWAASWNTSYDFEQSQFASHMVTLQRDMHDFRAIFSFTHSPNGNFAFNFFIALKPQPELKFDYSRATVRSR
jgi:hypothetical protein